MGKGKMGTGGHGKKRKAAPVLFAAAILALASLVSAGRGHGDGDDTKKDQEFMTPAPTVETVLSPTMTPEVTPTPEAGLTPGPQEGGDVAPEEFYVTIDRSDIFCGDEKLADAKALVEYIQQQVQAGADKGEDIPVRVILNDATAVANTFEDVKNALEQNGIPWVVPMATP